MFIYVPPGVGNEVLKLLASSLQLKEQYKIYERRTSLALIPFYESRIKFIEQCKWEKSRYQDTKADIELQETFKKTS